jgi:hypothetical protein
LPKPFCLAQSDVQASATRHFASGCNTAKIHPSNQEVEQPPLSEKKQLRKLEVQETKRKSRKTGIANEITLEECSLLVWNTKIFKLVTTHHRMP